MDGQRISRAMERIEAALARIEAVGMPSTSPPPNAQLVARHEALREAVGASMAELDTLIRRIEG